MDVAVTTGVTTQMYPNFPNTRPQTQQVVDIKLARDLKAYAQSWLQGEHPNFAKRQEKGDLIRDFTSRIKSGRCGCCNNGNNDCS